MIAPASDYRPIDARPVRQWTQINPLSLQKRGLVHWLPLGRLDIMAGAVVDRLYRDSAVYAAVPSGWGSAAFRGLYGLLVGGSGSIAITPRINTVPLTITFWVQHLQPWTTTGVEVYLGAAGVFTGFYTQLSGTSFAVNHAENNVWQEATLTTPVSLHDWHFCAAIFVSNADRWGYFDGIAGPHNTVSQTPGGVKNLLTIGGEPASPGNRATFSNLRDIRIYDRALQESELTEMYRNPYDMYILPDRDYSYALIVSEQFLQPPLLTSTAQVFAPSVALGAALTLAPPRLSSTATLFAPSVFSGAQPLNVPLLSSTAVVYAPSVALAGVGIAEDTREIEPNSLRVRITNFVSGDHLRIIRTYTELPEGVQISRAYLTIKTQRTYSDAQAIVQKQITSSVSGDGQITDDSTIGGSIELYFDLSNTDTALLIPHKPFQYDVQVITTTNAIYTAEMGVISMHQGVTHATT